MLLFSTILDLQDHVTPDDFIGLVLEWNAGSKYADNRVAGVDWHGEHNVRYGDAGQKSQMGAIQQENLTKKMENKKWVPS